MNLPTAAFSCGEWSFPRPRQSCPRGRGGFPRAAELSPRAMRLPAVCGGRNIPRRAFSDRRTMPPSALSFGVALVIAGFRVADGVLHARLGASGRFPYPRAPGRKSQNDQYGHGKKASHALSRLCCRFFGASGAVFRVPFQKRDAAPSLRCFQTERKSSRPLPAGAAAPNSRPGYIKRILRHGQEGEKREEKSRFPPPAAGISGAPFPSPGVPFWKTGANC